MNPDLSETVEMDSYHAKTMAAEPAETSESGADIPTADLLKIATPDYRSSEECILAPECLICRLDDALCGICRHIVNRAVD